MKIRGKINGGFEFHIYFCCEKTMIIIDEYHNRKEFKKNTKFNMV
jgi:hypothetical protein